MELLEIGQKVLIKRTNGRVHPVVVTRLNQGMNSLTVEWNESTDIKGKEVPLDSIILLNPSIFDTAVMSKTGAKAAAQASTLTLSRNGTNGIPNTQNNVVARSVKSGIPKRLERITLDDRMLSNLNTGIVESRLASGIASGRRGVPSPRISRCQIPAPNVDPGRYISGNLTSRLQQPTLSVVRAQKTRSPSPVATSPVDRKISSVNQRSSHVVKKVENLKDNREKRRAHHAELRQKKEELKNMDPGNPNWEVAHMIREYQKGIQFRPLRAFAQSELRSHQITVCVRKRPLSRKERIRKEIDIISVPRKNMLIVHEPRSKVDLTKFLEHHNFRFDYAFDEQCDNEIIYRYTAKPLVKTIFDGGHATCFAYGQTGSGKTHTMGGEFQGNQQNCQNGIYAMAARDVFAALPRAEYQHLGFCVSCSFFEIYGGKVFDLLGEEKQQLRVLEDGKQQVQVVGLTESAVNSVPEVLDLIQKGTKERTSGQTSANSKSSRSHAVFQIVLRKMSSRYIHGKFSFIDLAGNERGADTSSATRQTRMEGAEINKSLLALKECIRALSRQSSHLPFRVSKLTQVLRDSFIGGDKNKTCMIAMISPGLSSSENTLNTLRYADRVKELIAKESDNDDIDDDFSVDENGEDESEPHIQDQYMPRGNLSKILREKAQNYHGLQSEGHPSETEDYFNANDENLDSNGENFQQSNDFNDLSGTIYSSERDMSENSYNKQVMDFQELCEIEDRIIQMQKDANQSLANFIKKLKGTNYDYDRAQELFREMAEINIENQALMEEFRMQLGNEEVHARSNNI